MNRQLDIFSLMSEKYKINTDKVLLIELFAGIGAQHKALKYLLGDKMVSHKIVEWAYNSIITYNDIHIKDYTDYSKDYTMDELVEKIKGISVDYNKPLTVDQIKRKGEFNARRRRASLENDIALTLQTAQVNMVAERERV